jgi:flavin reductase (DIM6/NTAB) family NADH-FMN oxidoreductase RutF
MTWSPTHRPDSSDLRPDPEDEARLANAINTAMVIVTAGNGVGPNAGCLVGFHTQCSISPWRHLVLVSRANHTHRIASESSHLAVHVLDPDAHAGLAELFGAHTTDEGIDKFAHCRWTPTSYGPPILDDAAGWFMGAITGRLVAGDHEAFVVEPVTAAIPETLPTLLRYGDVQHLEPGHDA